MSINYDNTTSCTNDSQCKLAYSNDNWVCDTTNSKCALKCFSDTVCGENKYCGYNSDLKMNKCQDKNFDTMSAGCIPDSNISSVQSNANVTNVSSNKSSIENCVSWARTQTCDSNQKCNYMIYKEAIDTPIDWDNFTAKVSCGSDSYSITSKLKNGCTSNGDYNNCVYNSSNSLLKDILTTTVNDAINELNYNGTCTDYTLNYSYKCQNEPSGQTASKSVNFTSDEVNDLSVDITCPISESSDIESKCMATNLTDTQISSFSSNTDPNNCSYPLYNTPIIYSQSDLNSVSQDVYNEELISIEQELGQIETNEQTLEAKKLMLQKRLAGDTDFSLSDAFQILAERENESSQNALLYNQSMYNSFTNKISKNLKLQRNDSHKLNNLENKRILNNKKNLDGLDKEINTITNKIYKSQKKEQINVKVTYFLSLFLGIVFAIAALIFIALVLKHYKNGNIGN